MTTLADIARATLHDPQWLAHRYDPGHDAVQFIPVDRERRSAVPFLTDAELSPPAPRILARRDLPLDRVAGAPLHYIFHSAYCCSTLLARALDVPGVATTLKEPQLLNDLVGWRHRGASPDAVRAVLGDALTLLARPFAAREACVVKPSNLVNGLADAMLAMRPDARGILLYAPLPAFLASIARKGMWGRLWVRELLSAQLRDGLIDFGFTPRDHLLHTDLQVAAVGWLAQQALFARLATADSDRVRMLDSERLSARPGETLAAIAAHLGLALDSDRIASIVAAEFTRDAKTGGRFATGQRDSDRATGAALHTEEIEKVAVWAGAVADQAGIALTPAAGLSL